jgi:hypothetical protein
MSSKALTKNNDGDDHFQSSFLNPSHTHTNHACNEKQGNITRGERKTKGKKRSEENA